MEVEGVKVDSYISGFDNNLEGIHLLRGYTHVMASDVNDDTSVLI